MIDIECAGETLRLWPDKAVYWPAAKTLIIADLHLGKPAAFRAAGLAVPENTTAADLDRLENLLCKTRSRRLVVVGDLLHARAGQQEVMVQAVERWRARRAQLEIVLVPGNHDRKAGPLPDGWDIRGVAERWSCGPFVFSHAPVDVPGSYVIAGHLHPAIALHDKFGPTLRAPCFWFGSKCAVLPAFGSFTGMSNIKPAPGDRVFAVGGAEIIEVKISSKRARR